ncbi:MAG TPA: DOMON-like domain-containing protein [Allosphingosinicella sp.]|nr:DOMON-like domain-containing protein [Allosphingosinicella sp.]
MIPLAPHPDHPPEAVRGMEVAVERQGRMLQLLYGLRGRVEDMVIPEAAEAERRDGLWQTSCFEAFLRKPGEEGYYEFNFSPSSAWAAYRFSGYRQGMEHAAVEPPRIETRKLGGTVELRVSLQLPGDGPWQLGLSAVVEERGGRKSYWALAHPAAKADFHAPSSFIHEI